MKGVILCGGTGSRLLPMTRVTNKHLLPVYDRPMVYYPLQQLVHAGIREILLVTGGEYAGDFLRLLGNGRDFGLEHLDYTYQEGAGGIAEALGLAEHFADGDPVVVLLGDNIFQDPLKDAVEAYEEQGSGAMILLKEVPDPERFGVAEVEAEIQPEGSGARDGAGDAETAGGGEVVGKGGSKAGSAGSRGSPGSPGSGGTGRVVRIREKPDDPASPYAVTGCYFFDSRVFDIIRGLEPSERGELEITDVNNRYIEWGEMSCRILGGWWTDAGTIPSLHRAHRLVSEDVDNPVLRPVIPPHSAPAAGEV
ncbi:MAG: sugar phosphate nucleotidyltransferase [Gemmatimonadota bacterium]